LKDILRPDDYKTIEDNFKAQELAKIEAAEKAKNGGDPGSSPTKSKK
jgi:hypothetical protein